MQLEQLDVERFCSVIKLKNDSRLSSTSFSSIQEKLDRLTLLIQIECKNFFIAGGCLRDSILSKEYNDIDIWTYTENDSKIITDYLQYIMRYRQAYETDFAKSFRKHRPRSITTVEIEHSRKNIVQVIKMYASKNESFDEYIARILSDFDFTINQIAYVPASKVVYFNACFFKHLIEKKLYSDFSRLKHTQFILSRIQKFIEYSFTPSAELLQMLKESKLTSICSCGKSHFNKQGANEYVWTAADIEVA